jgi:hypothetical protein
MNRLIKPSLQYFHIGRVRLLSKFPFHLLFTILSPNCLCTIVWWHCCVRPLLKCIHFDLSVLINTLQSVHHACRVFSIHCRSVSEHPMRKMSSAYRNNDSLTFPTLMPRLMSLISCTRSFTKIEKIVGEMLSPWRTPLCTRTSLLIYHLSSRLLLFDYKYIYLGVNMIQQEFIISSHHITSHHINHIVSYRIVS